MSFHAVFSFLFITITLAANAAVFFEDFSSTRIEHTTNGFLGGPSGSSLIEQQWYGQQRNTRIENQSLTVTTSRNYRSAFIILSPGVFEGINGTYQVTLNVSGFDTNPSATANLRLWSASGYHDAGPNSDRIFVSSQNGGLESRGGASAALLRDFTITANGTHRIEFNYDGHSSIGVFLGAQSLDQNEIFINFNNIAIHAPELPPMENSPGQIPEPSSSFLVMLSTIACTIQRSRKRLTR